MEGTFARTGCWVRGLYLSATCLFLPFCFSLGIFLQKDSSCLLYPWGDSQSHWHLVPSFRIVCDIVYISLYFKVLLLPPWQAESYPWSLGKDLVIDSETGYQGHIGYKYLSALYHLTLWLYLSPRLGRCHIQCWKTWLGNWRDHAAQ